MKIKSMRSLANWQCSRMDNNKINKQNNRIYKPDYNWGLIQKLHEKKSNIGSGLYSANLLKSKICVMYRPMHFKGRKP